MVPHTTRRRRVLRGMAALGGVGVTGAIAGCSNQGSGSQATDAPATTRTATPTDADGGRDGGEGGGDDGEDGEQTGDDAPATVAAATHDRYGELLVDAVGQVLYVFEPDDRGPSACYDDCAATWPPLTVEAGESPAAGSSVSAPLGTVERDDGTLQVAAGGWPLYRFAGDGTPGTVNGQGIGNVWWVLRPDGAVARSTVSAAEHDRLGTILTDADGATLYRFAPDEGGASTCYGGCAESWPPLTVERSADLLPAATVSTTLGTVQRDDGSLQVTAGGWPLYSFARDEAPVDARGQEVGNTWFVLRPDGSPLLPTVSTRQVEGLGEILTDPDGMTLYRFEPDDGSASTCYGGCAEAWPPLTVEAADTVVPSVRTDVVVDTLERDDGTLQVTAGGWPLYHFSQDEAPGDAEGQGINDAWFVVGADGAVITPRPTPSGGGGGGGGY